MSSPRTWDRSIGGWIQTFYWGGQTWMWVWSTHGLGWVGLKWNKRQHYTILLWNWDSTVFAAVWICHI